MVSKVPQHLLPPLCSIQVVSWSGTSPDGRAVTGALSTMKALFNPNNTDED